MMNNNVNLYNIILNEARGYPGLEGKPAMDCLEDRKRTLALMEIIRKTTVPGSIGVDLGAGTGVLSLAFMAAGGKEVYAIDHRQDFCSFIEYLSSKLDIACHPVCTDATRYRPKKRPDYIMAELVATGLGWEPVVKAVRNIRRLCNDGCRYLPEAASLKVGLYDERSKIMVAPYVEYARVHLPSTYSYGIDTLITLPATEDGVAFKVVFGTDLRHTGGYWTYEFDSLCPTEYMDISKDKDSRLVPIRKGESVKLHIKYDFGDKLDFTYLGKV
jgi:hypothetical protein